MTNTINFKIKNVQEKCKKFCKVEELYHTKLKQTTRDVYAAVCQKNIFLYPDALGFPAWMQNFYQAKLKKKA